MDTKLLCYQKPAEHSVARDLFRELDWQGNIAGLASWLYRESRQVLVLDNIVP